MKKILGITLSVAAAIALSACSDDSASAPEETTPASTDSLAPASSDAIVPESSAAVLLSSDAGTLISSSSEALPVSSAETQPAVPCVDGDPVEVVPDTNGFADIGDVFKSVRCDEKVVFVLRHGEREAYVTRESELTEDGVEQAQTVGQKLIGTEDFTYSHTDFVRTEQTCLNIAIGRGQQSFPHDTNDIYQASWYVKDSEKRTEYNNMEGNNTNGVLAEWIFLGNYADAFYDLAEKSEEMIG